MDTYCSLKCQLLGTAFLITKILLLWTIIIYVYVHILFTGSGAIADTFGFIWRVTVTFISEITANRFHVHFSDCVSGSDIFWCNYSLLCGALITFPYIATGAEEQPKSQCVSPNLITISWFFLYDNTLRLHVKVCFTWTDSLMSVSPIIQPCY